LGLDKRTLSSNNNDATGEAITNNLPAGATSPRFTASSRRASLRRNPSGSPQFTRRAGPTPFPSSPTYLRPLAHTSNPSTSKGMFPTFRAESSFKHHPGMKPIIRDPIEVLERDEVGLIDELVEEEWLPLREDGDEEEEEGNGEEGNNGAKLKSESFKSVEGIPIPLVRNQTLGISHSGLTCGSISEGDEDDASESPSDVIDDGSLTYSRSPDSASDDGLESNTGQQVMNGVIAHSNSIRKQHSARRSSLEMIEAALSSKIADQTNVANGDAYEGHTATSTDPLPMDTPNTNLASSTAASGNKFVGNTHDGFAPSRPLGSQRSGTGMSSKSTDSIDEALRLHALSLNTPNPPPSLGGSVVSSQPPILEEEREKKENDNGDISSEQSRLSASVASKWRELPFTVRNAPLLRVIPKFYGVTHAEDRTLLELEDLARWYRHPCIMDIKVGHKTWYPNAEPDYIDRCKRKDAVTTQASLGFKICGMQVYRHARGGYWRASKRWCKTLPEALVNKALASFVNNEHGLRPADVYGGDQGVVAQLRALESWFQVQKEFHLYSASLLFLYEGDARGAEETNVRVRLVDFAHTFAVGGDTGNGNGGGSDLNGGGDSVATNNKIDSQGDIDENFLGGLRAIASKLNSVSTMEYVADTLISTTAV